MLQHRNLDEALQLLSGNSRRATLLGPQLQPSSSQVLQHEPHDTQQPQPTFDEREAAYHSRAAVALLCHVSSKPGGAEMLADPSRMQHLAAAAEWALTCQEPPGTKQADGCYVRTVTLLRQVAGAAAAAGRAAPWLPVLAALLQQQLPKLEKALLLPPPWQQRQQDEEDAAAQEDAADADIAPDTAEQRWGYLGVDAAEGAAAAAAVALRESVLPPLLEAGGAAEPGFAVAAYADAADVGDSDRFGEVYGAAPGNVDADVLSGYPGSNGMVGNMVMAVQPCLNRILLLLWCMMPLATCQQGLLALAACGGAAGSSSSAAGGVTLVVRAPRPYQH